MSRLLAKARTTVRSARLLLDAGDTNSAINRAYYAMFDAARAALETVDAKLLRTKTHATIIRRFGKHLVEGRGFDRSLGRLFAQTEDVRVARTSGWTKLKRVRLSKGRSALWLQSRHFCRQNHDPRAPLPVRHHAARPFARRRHETGFARN